MLTSEQREYLGMVRSSVLGLLTIINDILDFSKIEAGKLELEQIDFSLRTILGDTLKVLALRAHQKGLELIFDIHPNVPDRVVGDPGRLRQVITNLIGNAIKFTEKGEVTLMVDFESLGQEFVTLHFAVSDTGIGIPEDKLSVIFEAFSQADGSITRKYGGTGLGLTISTRLVELMHGQLHAESTPGEGSIFHFTSRFGLNKAPVAKPVDQVALLDGKTVLLVDDNTTNRRVLQQMVAGWNMNVKVAKSGSHALDETVLHRLGGNKKLLLEVASIFLKDYLRMMSKIETAIELGDPTSIYNATHTASKGPSATLVLNKLLRRPRRF
jgi:CheY-like chemotaxis protein